MTTEIKVPISWLKSLIELGKRVQLAPNQNYEYNCRIGISELVGYVSSAETIIKLKS